MWYRFPTPSSSVLQHNTVSLDEAGGIMRDDTLIDLSQFLSDFSSLVVYL